MTASGQDLMAADTPEALISQGDWSHACTEEV
jgi:hypothetical protein